jgi:voltage-gated potassium channel Kch
VFICCVLAVFAIEYDLPPHTSEGSTAQGRPLIDYLYYEVITFTTVGYGDIIPATGQGKLLAICTALLGATHGVTFVALFLQALTQHPPGQSQE